MGWVKLLASWAKWFFVSSSAFSVCLFVLWAVKDWDTWEILVLTGFLYKFVCSNKLSLRLAVDYCRFLLLVSQVLALSWWGCGGSFLWGSFLYKLFASCLFCLLFPWYSDSIGLSGELSLDCGEFLNDAGLDGWWNISWYSWSTLATWVLEWSLLSHFVGSWGGVLRSLLISLWWNFNLIQVFLMQFLGWM